MVGGAEAAAGGAGWVAVALGRSGKRLRAIARAASVWVGVGRAAGGLARRVGPGKVGKYRRSGRRVGPGKARQYRRGGHRVGPGKARQYRRGGHRVGPGKPGPYRRLGSRGGLGVGVEVNVGGGIGWAEAVVVGGDGVVDGIAPAVGAEGVDVFVLGEVDGLQLGLEHVGDGAGEAWFDVAADDGGDETPEGGAEIAGGEVVAGEEVVEIFGERFGGLRLGFLLGVVEAEVGMVADAWGAAAAAVFVRE